MTVSNSAIQVIGLTCSLCGHERRFARADLAEGQLYELETRVCERCGQASWVVMLSSRAVDARLDLEKSSD